MGDGSRTACVLTDAQMSLTEREVGLWLLCSLVIAEKSALTKRYFCFWSLKLADDLVGEHGLACLMSGQDNPDVNIYSHLGACSLGSQRGPLAM